MRSILPVSLACAWCVLSLLKLVPSAASDLSQHGWLFRATIAAELLMAAALLHRSTRRIALIASLSMSVVFIAATTPLVAWLGVESPDCGCFGGWVKAGLAGRRAVAGALLAASLLALTPPSRAEITKLKELA